MKYLTTMAVLLAFLSPLQLFADQDRPIRILFLGDDGPHRPAERFQQLQPVLQPRGIELTYTGTLESLNPEKLAEYDGLLIYANHTRISEAQEKALLDFVEQGKGFIPIHSASYCFLNSPEYVKLVGAQFQQHGTGTFRTVIAEPDHPIMQGFGGFESWDETYVHTRHHDQGRTVLEYRVEDEHREPWTWVRMQGEGRVFYTAWGHDHRTWGNPGFHNLIERGIRWATKNDPAAAGDYLSDAPFPVPEMTDISEDAQPFEYKDVGRQIPNYTPGRQWGTQGEPLNMMQLPLPAEESLKYMVVPQGFRVELFASEPDIGKPISMNWDERGRLWIAETVDYPNQLGQGRDRIRICEDTTGDGRADTFTVFAENLSIPASLTFYRNGVIVQDGTRTVYLKDTTGDDRADERRVLFTGWNMRDTHGGVSNFQYGLDNWIWAMQGYNQSRVEVGDDVVEFRQGFFRFKPDGSELEFLRSTNNNTWGLGISEEGLVFGSTANRNPSDYLPIPNRYYEAVRGWAPSLVLSGIADSHLFDPITDRVRQVDHHGGYTAAAGHALYTARNYPQEYWNRTAFVCEPTGHLVGTFVLRREGSHFRSTNPFNLLASADEWTAPIMAEVGPDGNVWVIDWYNFIIQHNPTPHGFETGRGAAYETDLRDKKHGRIYRLVYEGDEPQQPEQPSFSLAEATAEMLLETLAHDNMFWRRHAQRLLVERGRPDVVPALIERIRDPSVDVIGLNVGAIHALWTLHGLGVLDGSDDEATDAAVSALNHPSAGVRRNAVQVLPRTSRATEVVLKADLLQDPDAQVRLATLLALADLPAAADVGEAVAAVLSNPINTDDRWIPDAATSAAANNSLDFLEALAARQQPTATLLSTAETVAEHYARGGPVESVGELIAKLTEADPRTADAVVQGLASGWPPTQLPELDEQLEEDLETLVNHLPAERRTLVLQLATGWGSQRMQQYAEELARTLLARTSDASLDADDRITAAQELVKHQPTNLETIESLLELLTPQLPPQVATGLLRALEGSEVPEVGQLVLQRMAGQTPTVRAAAISLLLSRPQWTSALLEGADEGQVQLVELSLDQQRALADHPNRQVRRRAQELLQRGGALPDPDRQRVLEELLPITQKTGDPDAGRLVFEDQCAKCHVHGDMGTRIGPDLSGMAAHPKEELLVQIIDPSRSVESNYRVYTVLTEYGTILSGILASESRTAIELFDAEGEKHTILREDIEQLVASTNSLMPDGFEKHISRQQLTDLLEFLTQRGQFLPLPLDRAATVVSTRGMFHSEDATVERLIFDDWQPKSFQGVPFHLVDPQDDRVRNVILLHGPQGTIPPQMPRSVTLPCNAPARAIHMLSGVSGWGHPLGEHGSVSMIVRLHYEDGETEDHRLRNGEHFADYIRRVDVPGSEFAFDLNGRQIRYLAVHPQRSDTIREIEFVKGRDRTAPVVMAVTVEVAE